MPDRLAAWQKVFLDQHRLNAGYIDFAHCWFEPLAEALLLHRDSARRGQGVPPLLVAVNGSQGSGKSTLCAYLSAYLQAAHGQCAVVLSLDDFYLTRAQRRELAVSVHPLLATRGVPGTHDLGLLNRTLDDLLSPGRRDVVPVPRFDKARDDRHLRSRWDEVDGRLDVVLLEGWCLGARPQALEGLLSPVNELERLEDPDAFWRGYVNEALQRDFLPLYQRVEQWVMLAAPSFDCVYRWRLEQEHKLALANELRNGRVMSDKQVARFIQHYQRLTENCLAELPAAVDYLFQLDEGREIVLSRPRRDASA